MVKKEQNLKKTSMGKLIGRLSIRSKLIMVFGLTAAHNYVINIILYAEINSSMKKLDEVYATNVSLNELTECLENTQEEVVD